MPRRVLRLTKLEIAAAIRAAKATGRSVKKADGDGLFLIASPFGSAAWHLKIRQGGKERMRKLGGYPATDEVAAREAAREARIRAANKDPPTFKEAAIAWHTHTKPKWSERHAGEVLASLEEEIFPSLGKLRLDVIMPETILAALKQIEDRNAFETARRVRQRVERVFDYAIATGEVRLARNPAFQLRAAMSNARPVKRKMRMLPLSDLPEFLRKLEDYDGEELTKLAIKLCILTAARTNEINNARWNEFDLTASMWSIPGERMKAGEVHVVPLASQALGVLERLKEISGEGELVFPGDVDRTKPMSNNTMLFALYRMGYHSKATMHGMRSLFSTWANSTGRYHADVVEAALAHKEEDRVRAAYNRADHFAARKTLAQDWANFLDAQRTSDEAAPGNVG